MAIDKVEVRGQGSGVWSLLALLAILGAASGCKKSAEGPSQVHLKDAESALSGAGFKTDSLQNSDPSKFSGQKCVQGQLGGVDAVLCEYGSVDAVNLGKTAGEEWVGQAQTGLVVTNGFTVLALADRNRADPSGKTLQKMAEAYTQAR